MDTRLIRYTLLLFVLLFAAVPQAFAAGGFSQSSGPVDEAAVENQNRAIVRRIYDEVFNQDNAATAYALFATNLVQHDEGALDGPDGQLALFDNLRSNIPGVVATIKHIAAENDLVAVHWQASATPEDEFSGLAVVDLWRLTDGVVVEHWDGIQPVPVSSASGNSMFSEVFPSPQGARLMSEAERQMVVSSQTAVRSFPPVSGPRLTVTQSLADQDLVFAIHDAAGGSIGGDIFRVLNGKIIEHWDVIPPHPTQ
jgi:predicted SnoaL-like aldol condensation-catalyzing enzyme